MKAVIIAGTTSGVGKTTMSTGIMGALTRRNHRVQPFKTGPDYIDPTYHTWATGHPSRNLDTWMLSPSAISELFARAMRGKDVAIIEGVMGLYDGHSPTAEEGSTAQLAKMLGAPVILIADCGKAARSIAAVVTGYQQFDPALHLAGVILNRTGSDYHYQLCREAVEYYTRIPVLGHIPRNALFSLPERHLGLIPTVEGAANEEFLDRLVAQCESTLDISQIYQLSEQATVPEVTPQLFPKETLPKEVRIAVARDRAFSFYYQDSLDLLDAWGAELVEFSPLQDSRLDDDISGIYIGGGFPELYAEELAANTSMRKAIKLAAERGMPIYAECGGLMYLGKSIRDMEGNRHQMVGALPFNSQMDTPKLHLGYRTVEALADGPLLLKGQKIRAHEFHWSTPEEGSDTPNAYRIVEKNGEREGFQKVSLLASYIHIHLGSSPGLAQRFIDTCRGSGRNR